MVVMKIAIQVGLNLWGAIHSNWNFVLFSYDIYKNYIRNDMITTTRLSSFKSCSFVLKSCRFVFQLMSFCLKFQLMSLCLSTHVVMSFNSCRFVFQFMSFRHPDHVVMSSKSCRIVSASALSHATVACSRHSRTGALSATFWQNTHLFFTCFFLSFSNFKMSKN